MIKKFEEFVNERKQDWIVCYVGLIPDEPDRIGVYRSKNSESSEVDLDISCLSDKKYFKDTHIKLQPGVKVKTYFNLNMI